MSKFRVSVLSLKPEDQVFGSVPRVTVTPTREPVLTLLHGGGLVPGSHSVKTEKKPQEVSETFPRIQTALQVPPPGLDNN